MKTIVKSLMALVCILLLMGSCSKDKGNYDYVDLEQLMISADMDKVDPAVFITADSIELMQDDSLKVHLKIADSKGEKKDVSYTWYVTQYLQSSANPSIFVLDSTEVLRTKIRLTPNLYRLVVKVTDKGTGLSSSKTFSLNVSTAEWGGEGWLVLQETVGGSDLSVITTRAGEKKGKIFHNVYSSYNGHQLPIGTSRVNVIDYAIALRAQKVSFLYPNGALQVRSTDFADSSKAESWFLGAQPAMNVQLNGSAGSTGAGYEYLVVDNKLAYRQFASTAHLASPPLFFPPYEGLAVAPFVINAAMSDQFYTLYDIDNKAFRLFNAASSVLSNIPNYGPPATHLDPKTGQGFDLNKIGDNLVHAEPGQPINAAGNIYWNCFFRDEQQTKTYLLQFPRGISYVNNFTTGRFQLNEENCPGINTATLFANPNFLQMPKGVFYYVNENKVYTCQVRELANSSAQANLTFPSGTVIKAMKVFKSGYSIANITALGVPEGKVLVVATDESARGNGHKVYFFQIDAQTGTIKGSPGNPADLYTGFDKITDITFKKGLGR